jgi:hypothetical protein
VGGGGGRVAAGPPHRAHAVEAQPQQREDVRLNHTDVPRLGQPAGASSVASGVYGSSASRVHMQRHRQALGQNHEQNDWKGAHLRMSNASSASSARWHADSSAA